MIKQLRIMFRRFKKINNILSPINMKIVFCAIAQSVSYLYGIGVWGSTFETCLSFLKTTINSLLKIALRNSFGFHSNTDTDIQYIYNT